ncbi:MAG: nucleoside monophosphate kinase [Candidatus Pacebacteria bacterium]|nr:nucleoside monophosphate kinase [Candidatus Paceibacterota bacterium]
MNTEQKHLFFFVGRIASGKETQCVQLAEKLGYTVFSTGGKFREIVASGSLLGNRIKADYEKGLLMPSWVANYMLEEFLFNLAPERGAIFEGSGRDVEQAKVIDEVCTWLGRSYTVLNLDVSEDEVVKRSLLRGRDSTDKDESVIRMRLAEYNRLTKPAIEYFQQLGKCININGEQTPAEVHEEVMKKVAEVLK